MMWLVDPRPSLHTRTSVQDGGDYGEVLWYYGRQLATHAMSQDDPKEQLRSGLLVFLSTVPLPYQPSSRLCPT